LTPPLWGENTAKYSPGRQRREGFWAMKYREISQKTKYEESTLIWTSAVPAQRAIRSNSQGHRPW